MNSITQLCTGCRACEQSCPKQCIFMIEDEEGYLNAKIDSSKCIDCGVCVRTCPQNNPIVNKGTKSVYALRLKDSKVIYNSASGGVFPALAEYVISLGGVVFGAAYDDNMNVRHIHISNVNELSKIQGSKYVQSDTSNTYDVVKKLLNADICVLYTGTPCQIAGLKKYLKIDYNKLITADIVCHGVPSSKIFARYIEWMSKKMGGKIGYCNFRDKKDGWGLSLGISLSTGTQSKLLVGPNDSYYRHFLDGDMHRPCCYECRYCSDSRPADFTMGDYWGIEQEHPGFYSYHGVSMLMLNSNIALRVWENIKDKFEFLESSFEKASKNNGNLCSPSKRGKLRDDIYNKLNEYSNDEFFGIYLKPAISIKNRIKEFIPPTIRLLLKKIKSSNVL